LRAKFGDKFTPNFGDHELGKILDQGKQKAQGIAQVTLETVMARLGISGAQELLVGK